MPDLSSAAAVRFKLNYRQQRTGHRHARYRHCAAPGGEPRFRVLAFADRNWRRREGTLVPTLRLVTCRKPGSDFRIGW